jgi:hypothetical protein
VDFVMNADAFRNVAQWVHLYCAERGWRLCQVLRHETTAAYCVCSAVDDPAQAVALDVCSDYQRNGTLYLSAGDLLAEREKLPWGGHGLTAATELKYRFAKAAAKGKEPDGCAREFALYPDHARAQCAAWLMKNWGIDPGAWDTHDLAAALRTLRDKSNARPTLLKPGSPARIIERIVRPTGLVFATGEMDREAIATRIEGVFGHLYFRKVRIVSGWQPAIWKDLVTSTLILVRDLPRYWQRLLPADCIFSLDPSMNADAQQQAIAAHLNRRCLKREGILDASIS